MATSTSAVQVGGLHKSYGRRRVLTGLDLEVEAGSFHGIIGANGIGKTTLLEIIYGARQPDAGTVKVLGRAPLPRNPALLRRIGVQTQNPAFFPRASVWEHLATMASLFGSSAARTEQVLAATGLSDVANTRVTRISQAKRLRLALASAIVHRPEVLFLDEPTAGLDTTGRDNLRALLQQVRQDGTTIVCTIHSLEEAEPLCDVVSVLDGGQLQATAAPSSLIARRSREATILLPKAPGVIDKIVDLKEVNSVRIIPEGLLVTFRDITAGHSVLAVAGMVTTTSPAHRGTPERPVAQVAVQGWKT